MDRDKLKQEHHPEQIRERLENNEPHSHLGDAVLGAVDGAVTTFAVVAGAYGAGFDKTVVVVLGFANLLADGFSMAVSNYLGTKSERHRVEKASRTEEKHIDHVPDGEREEVRQIFAGKGFEGETLESVVNTITTDRKLWVETMLTEELGLPLEQPKPYKCALATFGAFLVVGLVPLLPFVLPSAFPRRMFLVSSIATGVAFFAVGVIKGWVTDRPWLRSGLETLLTGGAAATLAFMAGYWLRRAYGV
ncbi:MAG: VIT1/CCC1 transporter family protein [Syntrophotaleaceae bacterium]